MEFNGYCDQLELRATRLGGHASRLGHAVVILASNFSPSIRQSIQASDLQSKHPICQSKHPTCQSQHPTCQSRHPTGNPSIQPSTQAPEMSVQDPAMAIQASDSQPKTPSVRPRPQISVQDPEMSIQDPEMSVQDREVQSRARLQSKTPNPVQKSNAQSRNPIPKPFPGPPGLFPGPWVLVRILNIF